MRIFVSEYICGGGWPDEELPQSLASEGGAMLRALCEDCTRLPEAQVVTTRDKQCSVTLPDSVDVIDVTSTDEEWNRFLELSAAAEVTIVIAPELEDTLTTRVRAARKVGANVLAPPTDIIELCSDKLRLAQFLLENNITTIPTLPLSDADPADLWGGPLVVKPRFGAGSQDIFTVDAASVSAYLSTASMPPTSQRIVQPLIKGRSFSIGAICRPYDETSGSRGDILHLAQQYLSPDSRFQYLGGSIPSHASPGANDRMTTMVDACRSLLPNLAGYIGFDFVVPDDRPDDPLLVEINPRLCTSYRGYRAMTKENLAHRMLHQAPLPRLVWERQSVSFILDGEVHVIPWPEIS